MENDEKRMIVYPPTSLFNHPNLIRENLPEKLRNMDLFELVSMIIDVTFQNYAELIEKDDYYGRKASELWGLPLVPRRYELSVEQLHDRSSYVLISRRQV
jgi:hypothetical protein